MEDAEAEDIKDFADDKKWVPENAKEWEIRESCVTKYPKT